MQFIRSSGPEKGIADLSSRLRDELDLGKQVLWLVSGGSNIPASVAVMKTIPDDLRHNLTIMPCDERYGGSGDPGHEDSNWYQLVSKGFDTLHANPIPILKPGLSFTETVVSFGHDIEEQYAHNQTIIAQLGMGPDGHISGILPNSPAALERKALVVGYKNRNDPYERITTTFPALKRVSAIYLFAFHESKWRQLEILKDKEVDLQAQPVQLLKQVTESYIYNDHIGEPA